MTRGKYAAKANGQRADEAQNTATALRVQIAEMRREHAAEVAALKAQVDQLNGRLVSDVERLAAAEIERVQDGGRKALESERAKNRQRLTQVAKLLPAWDRGPRRTAELADLLGVKVGDLAGGGASRDVRRTSSRTARAAGANATHWSNPGGADALRLATPVPMDAFTSSNSDGEDAGS